MPVKREIEKINLLYSSCNIQHLTAQNKQPLWVFAALRARALRTPVFLGFITLKKGAARPPAPAHLSLAAPLT
jgi:hypothetical protein